MSFRSFRCVSSCSVSVVLISPLRSRKSLFEHPCKLRYAKIQFLLLLILNVQNVGGELVESDLVCAIGPD